VPSSNWEDLARENKIQPHIDPIFGAYKSAQFIDAVCAWSPQLTHQVILKTDLREEAFGTDEILFSLPTSGGELHGIDISPTVVHSALQRGDQYPARFIVADVRKLPYPDSFFDVVLSNSTLDHFEDRESFILSLREIRRVLKPNGRLILTVNNKHNLNFRLLLMLESFLKLKEYPVQFFSVRDVRLACAEVGLAIEHCDTIIHIVSPLNSVALFFRTILPKKIADSFASACLFFATLLGKSRWTKIFTGWFLAFSCVPEQKEVA